MCDTADHTTYTAGSDTLYQGGYKEMSSILADQYRPSLYEPKCGGLRGLSQWEQLCTSRDMESK